MAGGEDRDEASPHPLEAVYRSLKTVELSPLNSRVARTDRYEPLRDAQAETSFTDIERAYAAVYDLHNNYRGMSAFGGLRLWQKIFLASLAGLFAGIAVVDAVLSVALASGVLALLFLEIVSIRIAAYLMFQRPHDELAQGVGLGMPEEDLPVYTVLVPVFREAAVLPNLASALNALDYPREKLDIKIIFENIDHETLRIALNLHMFRHMEFVVVPDVAPRTKPKALNYALQLARGEFAVIYDAEDQPEPDQLKKAANVFRSAPKSLVCLQARLNFYNASENWLTKQFAIEYTSLFDGFMPALERMGLPIPLGGTSNHFRVEALRRLGAWDAFNLTEDADLGVRLHRQGLRCRMLGSTTYEEASCRLSSWMMQRTRWLKGWMQTYFVHMRSPGTLWRELGPAGFTGFQALIGGLFISALAHPLFYLMLAHHVLAGTFWQAPISFLGQQLWLIAMANLAFGYVASVLLAVATLPGRGLARLFPHIVFVPVYWLMISFAAYRAIYQLIRAPFHWEKTEHGISRYRPGCRIG